MSRDYQKEARSEVDRNDAMRRWVTARIDQIHAQVTAHDVLRRNGVNLKQGGSQREEQFSCPFHGKDNKPSARVYPSSARGPSHVWCYVCQEKGWDCITLWKKFSGFEGRFTALLAQIERDFGLAIPEAPPAGYEEPDDEPDELPGLFEICERRLRGAKAAFDMKGYLTVGSVLDKLYTALESGQMPREQAKAQLQKVLDKIGEKERACPGG